MHYLRNHLIELGIGVLAIVFICLIRYMMKLDIMLDDDGDLRKYEIDPNDPKFKIRDPSEDCDHLYWPVLGPDNDPIGQQCRLCGKFNSLKDLGLNTREEWLDEFKTRHKTYKEDI